MKEIKTRKCQAKKYTKHELYKEYSKKPCMQIECRPNAKLKHTHQVLYGHEGEASHESCNTGK